MNLQVDVGRKCGPCNACCKPFPVPEVGKYDSKSLCRHASDRGCAIYTSRPHACSEYACAWLNGLGGDDYRPDVLGIMIDVQNMKVLSRETGILHLWEVRINAVNRKEVRDLARVNKMQGMIIARHCLLPDGSYRHSVDTNGAHFSDTEANMFHIQYKEWIQE